MRDLIHIHQTAELAERVLLPGDPGRALRLAQALLDSPKMLNHNRGLWGYTGTASDGALLSIQSTGMGGPSAAIVVSELIDLGAQRLVRIGTSGALAPGLGLGDLIVAESVLAEDGVGGTLGAAAPDAELTARLAGDHRGPVVSTDLFYDPRAGIEQAWAARGALVVEMECAALFAVAAARGIAAGAVLLVSDIVLPARRRIDDDALHAGEQRLGAAALAALAV